MLPLLVSLLVATASAQEPAREFDKLVASAVELHKAGDVLGAIDAYSAALQIEPNHPGVRSNLGAAYVRLGKYDEAIEQYREALRMDAANQTVRFNLGLAYYKAARLPEAVGAFDAVVKAAPENAAAVLLLADTLLQSGRFQQVIDLLAPREEQFAKDLAFGYVFGTALLRSGQRERAQVYLDRIFKAGPSAEAHLLMGTALIETRDYPGAVAELRKALELNPNLATLRTVYARALLGAGDHEGALRELQRAVLANPNDFEANLQLAALLRRDDRHRDALTYFRRALDLRPQDAIARFGLGGALLSLGELEESRRVLEGVVAELPDYVEAHVLLATCYYRLKRTADGDRHRAIAERLREKRQPDSLPDSQDLASYRRRGEREHSFLFSLRKMLPFSRSPANARSRSQIAIAPAFAQTATPKKPAPQSQKTSPRPADPKFDRLVQQAAAARDARRIEESIKLYQEAVRLRPSWVEGYWHLGTAFYELDRHKDARDAFARVVRMEPKHASAHGFKGLCEFQLKDYETALSDLLNAADLGVAGPPDLVDAVTYHTAITLTRLEEYEFALSTLQSFARDGTDSPRVIEAFGMALLRIPMVPSELPPHRRELVMLAGRGAYYRAARRPAAAKPAFELLVQRYSDAPNAHYAYGVYLLDEDPGRAIEAFQQELKVSPGHVPSLLQIAFEYLRQSNWEEAKRWAQRVLEIEPRDWPARRAIGQALLEIGDVAGSIEQLEAGVKLAPDSPSMRFMLSRAYQRAGRDADAQRERTEFLRLERLVRSKKHGSHALGGIADRVRKQ